MYVVLLSGLNGWLRRLDCMQYGFPVEGNARPCPGELAVPTTDLQWSWVAVRASGLAGTGLLILRSGVTRADVAMRCGE